jgi:hypothetical protein
MDEGGFKKVWRRRIQLRRFLLFIIFFFVFASRAFCQGGPGEFVLPKGLAIVLPKDGSVKVEWIAPPLADGLVRKSDFSNQQFRMDKHGAVWMAHNQKFLTNLASGMAFGLARPVMDFMFLDDGALFIVSDTSLGFIPPFKREQLSQRGVPVLPFQPICSLPLEKCFIASDGKEGIYVYGYNPKTQRYAVLKLLKGFTGWQKVFISDRRISSVFVSADALFIAAGKMVFKLSSGNKEAEVIFSHPSDFVTGLAYQPRAGLFYATDSGIGLVKGAALEFMKCPAPQITIKDGKLYVFLPDTLGALLFENIEHLIDRHP